MESGKPISPSDIIENLDKIIPEVVINAVNNLLKKEYRGSSATLYQKDIVAEILKLDKTKELTSEEIFKNKWMNFEPIYRRSGWNVVYDSPAYNESYPETFTFTPKKGK